MYCIFSLGALHSDAYEAYQTSHDLKSVVQNACSCDLSKVASNGKMNIKLSLLTPILPMLVSCFPFNLKLLFFIYFIVLG